jgi:PTS system galactitol-specific IIA component
VSLADTKLIVPQLVADTAEDVISQLADKLTENGFVKDSFKAAVLTRESKFPTGLPTGAINVAIPHADAKYTNESKIAVATLAHPVKFRNMADTTQELDVSLVFMLGIHEAHGQVATLQKIMSLVQDQAHLQKLLGMTTVDDIFADVDAFLSDLKFED